MRRHLWVQAPLRVLVDGVEHRAAEWSLGGIAIDACVDTCIDTRDASLTTHTNLTELGAPVALQIHLPFQGFNISFDAAGAQQPQHLRKSLERKVARQ